MLNSDIGFQDKDKPAFPTLPKSEFLKELEQIPDVDDPEFGQKMLRFCSLPEKEIPYIPGPCDPFVVLPSDTLPILALKEACRHSMEQMLPRREMLKAWLEQMSEGSHPLQLKCHELLQMIKEEVHEQIETIIEGKINSLEKGIELLERRFRSTAEWLDRQFEAYENEEMFYLFASQELSRQIEERDHELASLTQQAAMIRDGRINDEIPPSEQTQVQILDPALFHLYLALEHSADFMQASVTTEETPLHDYREENAPSYREGYLQRQVITLPGCSDIGTVTFIRQVHSLPRLSDSDLELISYSQEVILRHLAATDARVIFDEGQTDDIPPFSDVRQELLSVKEVHAVFPEGIPSEELAPQQRRLLARLGAVEVYAALNPGVALMATAGKDFERWQLSLQGVRPDLKEACAVPLREQEAVRKIREYLSQHPGEEVFLVYGAGHFFNQISLDVKGDELARYPLIRALDWPALQFDLMQERSRSRADAIASASNPSVKHLLALNSEKLSVDAFLALADPHIQLYVLPKVIPDFFIHTSLREFACDLLQEIPSEHVELAQEILERSCLHDDNAKDVRAPFDAFVPREPDWKTIAKADTRTVDEAVWNEQHYPTRYEIMRRASSVGYLSFALAAAPAVQEELMDKMLVTGTAEKIFTALSAYATSSSVVNLLQAHKDALSGPFFTCRFDPAFLDLKMLGQLMQSDSWQRLTWDSRAEVVLGMTAASPSAVKDFIVGRIAGALEGNLEMKDQLLCAIQVKGPLHEEILSSIQPLVYRPGAKD